MGQGASKGAVPPPLQQQQQELEQEPFNMVLTAARIHAAKSPELAELLQHVQKECQQAAALQARVASRLRGEHVLEVAAALQARTANLQHCARQLQQLSLKRQRRWQLLPRQHRDAAAAAATTRALLAAADAHATFSRALAALAGSSKQSAAGKEPQSWRVLSITKDQRQEQQEEVNAWVSASTAASTPPGPTGGRGCRFTEELLSAMAGIHDDGDDGVDAGSSEDREAAGGSMSAPSAGTPNTAALQAGAASHQHCQWQQQHSRPAAIISSGRDVGVGVLDAQPAERPHDPAGWQQLQLAAVQGNDVRALLACTHELLLPDSPLTSQDVAAAHQLLSKAAALGCGTACQWLGELQEQAGAYKEAVQWFQRGAALGHVYCSHAFAFALETGLGLGAPDAVAAAAWYEHAARRGLALAANNLGRLLLKGAAGLPADAARGMHWLLAAAEGGSTSAYLNLGLALEQGLHSMHGNRSFSDGGGPGDADNLAAAAVCYSRAASRGSTRALLRLGQMQAGVGMMVMTGARGGGSWASSSDSTSGSRSGSGGSKLELDVSSTRTSSLAGC